MKVEDVEHQKQVLNKRKNVNQSRYKEKTDLPGTECSVFHKVCWVLLDIVQ